MRQLQRLGGSVPHRRLARLHRMEWSSVKETVSSEQWWHIRKKNAHVCVCVCIYVYMYICIYVYTYTYTYMYTYMYIYIYMYIHTYIHTYIHYITLHYITLHYITLHYITLHYITLHYITLHYITLHYITLHYITLHYIHTYITLRRYIYIYNKQINNKVCWLRTFSNLKEGKFGIGTSVIHPMYIHVLQLLSYHFEHI